MKFSKNDLSELVFGENVPGYKMIRYPEIVGNGRWDIDYEFIFQAPDGKLYQGYYSTGATEHQDHCAFEYEDDPMECQEVQTVQKMVTVYEKVK